MAKKSYFSPELFKFQRELKRHNDREWFQANKWRYEQFERDPFLRFIEDFRQRLNAISPHFIADPKPSGGSLLRIYRDMRFRKCQAPYQTMVAARLPHRAWKEVHAPGLYLHLEPRRSFLGAAFGIPIQTPGRWYARRSFATRRNGKAPPAAGPFKALCELSGDSMKRMPSSYEPDHPFARDLMRKDFMTDTYFTEKQVCALDFLAQVLKATRAAGPFLEFLTHAVGLPWGRGRERQTARAVEN